MSTYMNLTHLEEINEFYGQLISMDMIFVFVLETRCLAKLFQISLHECEATT